MQLGTKQVLPILRKADFGVYLGDENEQVLLPARQVPPEARVGDSVEVFLYRDSMDRPIATTTTPKLIMGELATLQVVDVNHLGAFLDWGLEKDLFLPFQQQTRKVQKGDLCVVGLYLDKSDRLCATMKIEPLLSSESPYRKDAVVEGIIYEINEKYGVYVAVDGKYRGMIPKREGPGQLSVGACVQARVSRVKPDGKLDLSMREKIPVQMEKDAEKILKVLQSLEGDIPFGDKTDPETIRRVFGMSKAAFKRGLGRLLREKKITMQEGKIIISR